MRSRRPCWRSRPSPSSARSPGITRPLPCTSEGRGNAVGYNVQTQSLLLTYLVEAFAPSELEGLLRSRLDLRLDRVADPSQSFSSQVFQVVQLADRAGWTADLIRVASEARPRHEGLAALARHLGLAVALDTAAYHPPAA